MDEQKLLDILRERLTAPRYEHSINVAESAEELALHFAADRAKARRAGLLHDICKCDSVQEMTLLLEKSGYTFIDCERGNAKLLHAPAGAVFLRVNSLCRDEEILDAVRYHTTGRANMSLLEKIVFIADLISADRDYPDLERVRKLAFEDLDKALRYSLSFIISDFERKGESFHPNGRECLESFTF